MRATLHKDHRSSQPIICTSIDLDNNIVEYVNYTHDKNSKQESIDFISLPNSAMRMLDFMQNNQSRRTFPGEEAVNKLSGTLERGFKYLNMPLNAKGNDDIERDSIIYLPDHGLSIYWENLPVKINQGGEKVNIFSWGVYEDTYTPASYYEPEDIDERQIAYFPIGHETALVSFVMHHVAIQSLNNAIEALLESEACDDMDEEIDCRL